MYMDEQGLFIPATTPLINRYVSAIVPASLAGMGRSEELKTFKRSLTFYLLMGGGEQSLLSLHIEIS